MKKVICRVDGMSCAACSAAVERALASLPSITELNVSLATNEASFVYDETSVTEQEIMDAVAKAGYSLSFPAENEDYPSEIGVKHSSNRNALLVCIICTFPLFVTCIGHLLFQKIPMLPAFMQILLCIPVLAAGQGIFKRGISGLLKGHPNMDSLVSIGAGASFIYSTVNLFTGSMSLYFEGVATIITLVMCGKAIEAKSRQKAGDSIRELIKLAPAEATVIQNGNEVRKPVSLIRDGDMIKVRPGEKIAADGIIIEGASDVNEAMLTGESLPCSKKEGSYVYAATLNLNGSFVFKAEHTGKDTALSSIIKMVKEAQSSKAPIQRVADKAAGIFCPVVMIISLITLCAWLIAGRDFPFALKCAVSVLVVACPCSLGLATPIAIQVAAGKGANMGVFFRNAQAIENLGKMENIMFDKTGTLTTGKPEVVFSSSPQALELAAIAEQNSEHPFAKAVLDAVGTVMNVPLRTFTAVPGQGIVVRCEYGRIIAGNRALMDEYDIEVPQDEPEAQMYVGCNGEYKGYIIIKDSLRDDAAKCISELHKLGLRCTMLTGDNEESAEETAEKTGIDTWHSRLLPAEKLEYISKEQNTVMVGDGINDAPALEKANIGIAMGSGTHIAMSSADIVIAGDTLKSVAQAVKLSRATLKNIKLSLFWAFFYNSLGIPIAAGILTLFSGPELDPMICALCMSLSSICVVLNALRLKHSK